MKHKPIIAASSVLLVIAAVLTTLCVRIAHKPEAKDLTATNGCPEFFDLTWGLTGAEASIKIDKKHYFYDATVEEATDSFISAREPIRFYSLKAASVYCSFPEDHLTEITFLFPREGNTLAELSNVLTEVYGQMTSENKWAGPTTTIELWDHYLLDTDEKVVAVRYSRTPGSQYTMLYPNSGSEVDPFALATEHNLFGKKPSLILDGLVEGLDYRKDADSSEYTTYTLYPPFTYMGLEEGYTAIELYARDKGIIKASYVMALNNELSTTRATQITNIYTALQSEYGLPHESSFSEFSFDEATAITMTETALLDLMHTGQEGLYHMTWKKGITKIVFCFILNNYDEYTYSSVSFLRTEE